MLPQLLTECLVFSSEFVNSILWVRQFCVNLTVTGYEEFVLAFAFLLFLPLSPVSVDLIRRISPQPVL